MARTLLAGLCALLLVFQRASQAIQLEEEKIYPDEPNDGRTPLYFSLIQSFSGQLISVYSLTGLQLALDLINDDPSLLPGYSLHYVFTDAPCTKIDALNALHHQVFQKPTKIGIIGSGCSVSTEPTASISHYYNLVQVSCVASSPAFRNRDLFRRYFQLLPTDASQNIAYLGVFQHYKWKRVAIIVQDENLFTVAVKELIDLLEDNDIEHSETELVINEEEGTNSTNSTIEGLSEVFDAGSRIFILAMYEPLARQIICEAYRQGYKYPRYIFFTIPWYVDDWWKVGEDDYGCTVEQLKEVLEYSLSLVNLPFAKYLNENITTETGGGMTVGEYLERQEKYVNQPPLYVSRSDDVAPVCYDAMWTLALALNKTIAEFENNTNLSKMAYEAEGMTVKSEPFRIENFTYKNEVVMETMFKYLEETDFLGVSGQVNFNELGIRRVTQYLLVQLRRNDTSGNLSSVVVGEWKENHSFIYETGETDDTIWPLGVPYDGVSVNEEVLAVHLSLTIILTFLSSAGIIFSIVCLIFNFYFRNQTLVRLTSPNLNYLIGSGAILLYIAIILTVLPAKTEVFAGVLCNLRVWLTGFGYSLCYGTILVKMWRVYYIFSNPSAQKKTKFHDWMLAVMVLCFVVIDLIMLVGFTLVEGVKGNLGADKVLDKEHSAISEGNQGRIREYYVYLCDSKAWDVFLGVFYGYKALLQICGLFLAFATRKVKVRGLDDAKWIAATIYITSIVLTITILSLYTLNDRITLHGAVFTTGLLIGTTFIMAFVFVSKMYALYKDPEGKRVFDKSSPSDRQSHRDSMEQSGNRYRTSGSEEKERDGHRLKSHF